MHKGTWKKFERDVAWVLGGERRPVMGKEKGGTDIDHPKLSIQCKKGRRFPEYLQKWLKEIRENAEGEKIGIVVWQDKGEPVLESLVCLSLQDFHILFECACGLDVRFNPDSSKG